MWFLNCNCWRPSNSDNTKKHRDNTPNIWPQSLHSPDPPISWAEQVVLIFHAFNVFATLIPPPLWPLVYSSSHESPFLFHSCWSCFQEVPARPDRTLSTVPERWPLLTILISASPLDAAPVSLSPQLHLLLPPFSLLSSFLFLILLLSLFSFPLSFPLTVVVDWVSECLWQLCVVCNRAERLV